ncbi:MAG: tetratricopeptide repeat protein [Planctomycetota bacterium]
MNQAPMDLDCNTPESQSAIHHRRARRYLEGEQWERARDALLDSLAAVPGQAPVLGDLAHATMKLGDLDDAQRIALDALGIDPDQPTALWVLGNCLTSMDQTEDAESVYESALARYPESIDFHLGFARLCKRTHRLEPAQRLLENARRLDPSDLRVATMLTTLYSELGRHDLARSINLEALASAPNDDACHAARGIVALRSGRRDEALSAMREAVRLEPSVRNVSSLVAFEGACRPKGSHIGRVARRFSRIPGIRWVVRILFAVTFCWLWAAELPRAAVCILGVYLGLRLIRPH